MDLKVIEEVDLKTEICKTSLMIDRAGRRERTQMKDSKTIKDEFMSVKKIEEAVEEEETGEAGEEEGE